MAIISADSLQLAHVAETTPGVTPQSPGFVTWRTTGESLVFAPQVSDSAEIGGSGRTRKPGNVTGFTINGDINFELAPFTALQQAIAGVLAAAWGECPLTGAAGGAIDVAERVTVGQDLQTYTIEKRFPRADSVPGTLLAAALGGAALPTASDTITLSGGPSVGSGYIVVDITVGTGEKHHVEHYVAPNTADAAAATALAATLNAFADVSATAAAGVITVTGAAGADITSFAVYSSSDQYVYQRFVGATYSALSLSAAPNATVTGSVTVVGGVPSLSNVPLQGATYAAAGSKPVFTAPQLMELSIGQALGIGTHCWTSLNINIDSANRGVPCIGTTGDREVVLGTLSASVSGDVYFVDQAILEHLLENKVMGDGVITFSNGADIYRFDFYGLKPVSGQVAAGGAGQDIVIPVELQPTPVKVCEDAAGSPWDSGFIISTVDSAPTLP